MNRRVWVWIGSVLGCVLLGYGTGGESAKGAPAAPAAAAPMANPALPVPALSPTIVNATATPTPSSVAAMRAFVATQLAGLASPLGPVVTASRAGLVGACPRTSAPSFHDAYTKELNAAVLLALAKSPPMAVKVNLCVVMDKVGTAANTTQMEKAVEALLADRNDGVVLDAIHAARPMVISLLTQPGGPGKSTLFNGIVSAVRAHTTGDLAGLIAADAYQALVVKPENVPLPQQAVLPLLKPLFDPILDLLALRVQQYDRGLVPAPEAEAIVPTFLTRSFFTPGYMTVGQQQRSVQLLVNLLDAVAQRSAAETSPAVLKPLLATVKNAAGGLNVMSRTTLLAPIGTLPPGVTGKGMAAACATAYPSMSIPFGRGTLFPNGLAKPPTLPAVAPKPGPAAPGAAAPGTPPAAGMPQSGP